MYNWLFAFTVGYPSPSASAAESPGRGSFDEAGEEPETGVQANRGVFGPPRGAWKASPREGSRMRPETGRDLGPGSSRRAHDFPKSWAGEVYNFSNFRDVSRSPGRRFRALRCRPQPTPEGPQPTTPGPGQTVKHGTLGHLACPKGCTASQPTSWIG
jgi:hypothetical protein